MVAGAGQAAADEATPRQGGATATIGGLKTFGAAVIRMDSGDQQVSAGLFEMSVEGGGTLQTYCVDINTPTQKDAKYHETAWSGTSRSEEHTSELQSRENLVCRLLLEKKKKKQTNGKMTVAQ